MLLLLGSFSCAKEVLIQKFQLYKRQDSLVFELIKQGKMPGKMQDLSYKLHKTFSTISMLISIEFLLVSAACNIFQQPMLILYLFFKKNISYH